MTDLDLVESLKVELTCPVCLGYFLDPVMGKCGHTFCRECLFRDWEDGQRPNTCPLCKASIHDGDTLRSNRRLKNLVTMSRVLRPLFLQSNRGLPTCKHHGKEENLFCEEDHRPLCGTCFFTTEHKKHRVLSLEEAAKECIKKLQDTLKILQENLEKFQFRLDQEMDKEINFRAKDYAFRASVQCEYRNMHQILLEQEELHLQRLDLEARKKRAEFEENQASMGRQIHILQMTMAEIEKNLEKSPEEMLQKPQSIWNTLRRKKEGLQSKLEYEREKEAQCQLEGQAMKEEVISEYQKKHQALSEEEELCVKRLDETARDNLAKIEESQDRLSQHIHNLEMVMSEAEGNFDKSLLEMLLDGKGILERSEELLLQDPGVESSLTWTKCPMPAMTEMLMTFHRDLTLDPQTANSHLLVSDNLKSVTYVRVPHDLAEDSKTFGISNTVLLATQSFTSGKHYWEVEVGDKIPWEVGVFNGSNRKKNKAHELPWTVCSLIGFQSENDFTFWNSQGIYDINIMEKLGIFLDYEKGHIAFYNATDRTLLYSIPTLGFHGPVYPCFFPFLQHQEITHGHLSICPRSK